MFGTFFSSADPMRTTSLLTSKFSLKSQARLFDETEHISYANVSSGKGTMPAEQQSSQEQYQALSVRARDSAAANVSLTWPCTEPCVFSITSRCAAFMDCRACVLKWTQQCTGQTASIVICPNKYAEWRAYTSVAAWAESLPGNDMFLRTGDQTCWEKAGFVYIPATLVSTIWLLVT